MTFFVYLWLKGRLMVAYSYATPLPMKKWPKQAKIKRIGEGSVRRRDNPLFESEHPVFSMLGEVCIDSMLKMSVRVKK